MHNITFISTIHKEAGKCSPDELHLIIQQIRPDVIFLEALEDTYSEYQKHIFENFGVFNDKLEIAAIQQYSNHASFEYVPVLDSGLTDSFDNKYNSPCMDRDPELNEILYKLETQTQELGFKFLNSLECIELNELMRERESQLLAGSEVDAAAKADIDSYENSMIRNIYNYCKINQFNTGIFMVGSAHRKSIIEKIEKFRLEDDVCINWKLLEI